MCPILWAEGGRSLSSWTMLRCPAHQEGCIGQACGRIVHVEVKRKEVFNPYLTVGMQKKKKQRMRESNSGLCIWEPGASATWPPRPSTVGAITMML